MMLEKDQDEGIVTNFYGHDDDDDSSGEHVFDIRCTRNDHKCDDEDNK